MNKLLWLALSVSLGSICLSGTTVYAEEVKIGAVNVRRVLEQSPQTETANKQIEKEFAPRNRKLVAEQKSVKEMEDRLNKDAAIMNDSERRNLERDIISRKRDLKRNQEEYREDLNFRRNEEFSKIQKDVIESIQQVSKENSYDIVLGEGVIYASSKTDMSDLVIEKLKEKYNAGSD